MCIVTKIVVTGVRSGIGWIETEVMEAYLGKMETMMKVS
jgi:hypothetical protein